METEFKRLISLTGTYSIGNILMRSSQFFLIPIYTYFLTTRDFGIIGLMGITSTLIATFVSCPVRGFIRFYHAPEYKNKQKELTFNSLLFIIVPAILCAAALYFLSNKLSLLILDDAQLQHIVKIYAFILFGESIQNFLLALLRMQEKAKLYVLMNIVRFFVMFSVTLFLLSVKKIGVLALVWGIFAGEYIFLIALLPYLISNSKPKLNVSLVMPAIHYGYGLILTSFSNQIIQQVDRYVLRIFRALSQVGLYSFGYNFAGIIQLLLVLPLKTAIQPILFKMEENPQKLKKFASKVCTYYYIIAMFFCLGLSLLSKEIIHIMAQKEEFYGAWVIVPIVSYAYVHHGLGELLGWGLIIRKKVFLMSMTFIISAITNLAFNFLLIPRYGIFGAAVATLISYLVWNGLKAYYSAKLYNLHFELGRLAFITIVGVSLYVSAQFITNTDMLFFNILIKFLIIFSYPLLLFITGFFTQEEKSKMHMFIMNIRNHKLYRKKSQITQWELRNKL